MSPNTIPSCVTYIKQCDHLHQLMFIVFTVQPLVCCNKNDMEKVGQDSVSDICDCGSFSDSSDSVSNGKYFQID